MKHEQYQAIRLAFAKGEIDFPTYHFAIMPWFSKYRMEL